MSMKIILVDRYTTPSLKCILHFQFIMSKSVKPLLLTQTFKENTPYCHESKRFIHV